VPQTHWPSIEQLSLTSVLHEKHAVPLPHCGKTGVMQPVPLQHWPMGHPEPQPVHAPALQLPGEQFAHGDPLMPQDISVAGWHFRLLSQHPGHDESQTH
jgi:hypothetical protein